MKKNSISLICVFWTLKILMDLFYEYQVLDIIISIFALFIFLLLIIQEKLIIKSIDVLVIIMMCLYTISYLKDLSYYIDYLKIMSCFVMYFIGRLSYTEEERIEKSITRIMILIFIVNLVVCMIGKGSITWGSALTLKGLYYFKTDYACFLSYFLIYWLILNSTNKKIKLIITLITLILIILTNARIYYLISSIIIFIAYLYNQNKKIVNTKNIIKLSIFSIIVIIGISMLSKLSFFTERNMIGIELNIFDSVAMRGNTQGRNIVWQELISNFNNQAIITKIFGSGLFFKDIYGYQGFHEHSTYVKALVNTGYFGLLVLLLFFAKLFNSIIKNSNRKIQYITLSLLIIFIVAGVSSPTLLYSNTSWLPMFYFGICVSTCVNKSKQNKRNGDNYEKN